tara:strand:- start:284 stop:574 length:291 start_codon:yes stop_codon:yes gene_type:complete
MDYIANSIQFVIAFFMGVTAFLSYLSIRQNTVANLNKVFSEIVKEEMQLKRVTFEYNERIGKAKGFRKVQLKEELDILVFNYYDYLAILYLKVNLK